ncbi:MAG: RNA polymerase sigma factor [Colwellia sp.]|nr:RNA polymerase sigma factor [Colwellia sp.]
MYLTENLAPSKSPAYDFYVIWGSHRHRIYSCCLKWLNGDKDKADDAMSLASEKALRYFQSDQEQVIKMYPWLCKLAYNICIDMHRIQTRQYELVNQVSALPNEFYFSDNSSEELEEQIERESKLNFLMRKISILPIDLMLPIKYRFFEELEYSEIARRLNISPNNVRKRIQLARQRLRYLLEHE